MHARQTPTSKVILTDAARSGARVLQTPGDVSQTGRDVTMPGYGKNSIRSPMFNSTVLVGGGTTISPTRTGIQEIGNTKCSTGSVEVRNAQMFHTSTNGNLTEYGDPTPTFIKVIGQELSHNSITKIYSRCWVNFTRNAVGTEIPDFMNLGLLAVHASDKIGSFGTSATRVGRPTNIYNWIAPGHFFGKATAVGMSGMRT